MAKKCRVNPVVAVVLSFLWPGIGHIYVGSAGLGIMFAILVIILGLRWGDPLPSISYVFLWIFSMVDSYNRANRICEEMEESSESSKNNE